jgi:DNA-directed RNA polymerase specialized sigma24 family protein
MLKNNDKTTMGGKNHAFRTTCWYDIEQVKKSDRKIQRDVIEKLIHAYWKPVYCYLRYKGRSNELAKDLTQGFFESVVLENKLFIKADKAKGRFRAYLLTALDNYVANEHRRKIAKKKSPEGELLYIEELEQISDAEVLSEMTPDKMFYYTWASKMLDESINKVKDELCFSGKEKHWEVFYRKVLGPIFDDTSSLTLSEICNEVEIESESKASNMIVTVKRRFAKAINRTLRNYTSSDEEAREEFNQLKTILSNCAG